MEMAAERLIAAPRQHVWQCLNDPEVLKACIPGCESIETTGADSYKIAMVAAVGFIKAKFVGDLELRNKNENTSYDISFNGTGGAAGFGKGGASVSLADAPEGTRLAYRVQAQVGGKLAQVGARVIDGVAKKMADEFFQRLDAVITRTAAPASPVAATAEPAQDAAVSAARPARSLQPWLYAAAALVAIVVVALALGAGGTAT